MADLAPSVAACFGLPALGGGPALAVAEAHFAQAAFGDEPLFHSTLGLRSFLIAVAQGEHRAKHYQPDRLCELSARAAPMLVGASSGVSPARIAVGFATFRDIARQLSEPSPSSFGRGDVMLDRLDQVAMFANELDAARRRASINARGAPLARFNAIQAALFADPVGEQAH